MNSQSNARETARPELCSGVVPTRDAAVRRRRASFLHFHHRWPSSFTRSSLARPYHHGSAKDTQSAIVSCYWWAGNKAGVVAKPVSRRNTISFRLPHILQKGLPTSRRAIIITPCLSFWSVRRRKKPTNCGACRASSTLLARG